MHEAALKYLLYKILFIYLQIAPRSFPMSAESMMFNGFIIAITTVLFGLAWGFLILKVQDKATKSE